MPFIIFIFGLVIGSFLNVAILRYGTGESIFKGKSRCLNCGKNLRWHELIPLISFLIQKGRCKNCESKISIQYPLVELLTGIIFLLVAAKIFNFSAQGGSASGGQFSIFNQFLIFEFLNKLPFIAYYLTIFSLFIVISVYDIRHQIIPDKFVYSLIIISFFAPLFNFLDSGYWDFIRNLKLETYPVGSQSDSFGVRNLEILNHILTGFILFGFFGLLWLMSKGKWMGFGDAKLALGIGFLLGPAKAILAFLFSFWFGAIFGICLLIFSKGKVSFRSSVPFGPFLSLGAFLAFLIEANFF